MSQHPVRILFLCTHNRCRSILAEALTRHHGQSLLIAASAGSQPEGKVHPDTLKNLQQQGISIDGLHSKSWNDMADFNPHYSIAVCEQAAGETCPAWMQDIPMIPWALPDPSKISTSNEERERAFKDVMTMIETRINSWLELLREGDDTFFQHMDSQLARRNTQSLN